MTNYFIPDPSKPLLIDISKWQNDIATPAYVDFHKMKGMGVVGVIMKAGQGLFLDRDFLANWGNAKSAKMPRGVYWYYDNSVSPITQANNLIRSVVDITSGELGIWLDLEDRREGIYKGWKNWYNFLFTLRIAFPSAKIGIYTGHYYWVEFTAGSGIPKPSLNWFKQFPLWIASYGSSPLPTAPWDNYTIWQMTDLLEGELYGVESKELDGNYFNGSLSEYNQYFGISGDAIPEVPTEDGKMLYNMTTISNSTRIRTDHNTFATVIGSIPANSVMQGSQVWTALVDGSEVKAGDKWMYVTHENGIALAPAYVGWMAYIHKGVPICKDLKEVNAPSPTEITLTHTIEVYSDGSIKVDGKAI